MICVYLRAMICSHAPRYTTVYIRYLGTIYVCGAEHWRSRAYIYTGNSCDPRATRINPRTQFRQYPGRYYSTHVVLNEARQVLQWYGNTPDAF